MFQRAISFYVRWMKKEKMNDAHFYLIQSHSERTVENKHWSESEGKKK